MTKIGNAYGLYLGYRAPGEIMLYWKKSHTYSKILRGTVQRVGI